MIDELQSRSKASKQENMQTIPLWAQQSPGSPYRARPDTKKIPLKEQLKSNDCKLGDDSSTDRLFPMKLDIGLPLT